jgi:hypothetical protein
MNPRSIPITLALASGAALLPLGAQTPLFSDSPVVGGSKVFSEGINPLGNPSRFDRPTSGWYLTWLEGDERASDNSSLLQGTTTSDPAGVTQSLQGLQNAPWAQRSFAYGMVGVKDSMNFGYTHEEYHSLFAYPDLAPVDLGSLTALANNQSYVDGRRTKVDRLNFGGGSLASGTSVGYNFRLESWKSNVFTPYFNQAPGTFTWAPGGLFPYPSVDDYVMNTNATNQKATNWALDVGFTTDLADGVRIGATADQLNSKRLWDVDMKPQFRAALQVDLGTSTQLTFESDLNQAARMPFPQKQESYSASLRYQVSPAVILILGGENRKIGGEAVTRGGATIQLRTSSFLLAVGFQAGQDRPMKAVTLMVD